MNILSIVGTKDLSSGGPIYLANSQKKFLSNKCNIKLISINNVSILKIFIYYLGYKKKKLENILLKFDVIHFHEVWNVRHHLMAIKLRVLSIPFLFSAHGHFDKWSVGHNYLIKKFFYFVFKKNFIASSGVQISTIEELREARIFTNNNNIKFFLISNGVEITNEHETIKNREFNYNKIKLLFFGRIHPKKGINLIIETFYKLLNTNKNYTLTIVGPGDIFYLKKLRRLAHNLKINSYLKILPPVFDKKSKLKILKDYDIFLLPSFEEADSIALKEALASGLPVIISKQCRLNDVAERNCGLIIENNKIEDLLLAIHKISNKELLNTMHSNAIKLIHEKYGAQSINENFYDIYFDAINGTRLAKNWSCNNIL
jgi:glycosyltransferase involved in cell wall biosynthesis